MPRYLIVANQTLGGQQLNDRIEALVARCRSVELHLRFIVPVTETEGLHGRDSPPIHEYVPDPCALAQVLARARLERELERWSRAGSHAEGEVVDPDPVERVTTLAAAEDWTGIVVSTLPRRLSRWLHTDLPSRIAGTVSAPVIHVEGDPGPSL